LKWNEIRPRSVYGSAGPETIVTCVALVFMGPLFYNQFFGKWFGHSSFAEVAKICMDALHREIESAMSTLPDRKTRR